MNVIVFGPEKLLEMANAISSCGNLQQHATNELGNYWANVLQFCYPPTYLLISTCEAGRYNRP